MKMTFLLLAVLALIAAGCQSTSADRNSGSVSGTLANEAGVPPAGGGTTDVQ